MINPMDLTGKNILVTGASSGIGKTTALQLSKLGASLVLISRNIENLKKTISILDGDKHAYYAFDLSKLNNIEDLIKEIVNKNGAFSGFVHCAGIGKARPISMLGHRNVMEVMEVNYFAFIEIARCITKRGFFEEKGSIVGISSISSIKGYKSKIAYNSSKAAMDSAIRCMALELGKKNIRVNSIMPGWVKTEMYDRYLKRSENTAEENENINRQFLGLIDPIEIANVVAFLLSDATKTITGTSILIDGGLLQS